MPWRGRYNSTAGKVCLTNAYLSSLPMFLMGFYHLPNDTHDGYDKHRSDFYSKTVDNKKKYRSVKWKIMCRPKSLGGGLGIMNTAIMNKCLIIKWCWKILTTGPDTLWFQILKGLCLRLLLVVLSFGVNLSKSLTISMRKLSLWLIIGPLSASGLIGDMVTVLLTSPFRLSSLFACLLRFPSRISRDIIGI